MSEGEEEESDLGTGGWGGQDGALELKKWRGGPICGTPLDTTPPHHHSQWDRSHVCSQCFYVLTDYSSIYPSDD